MSSSAGDTVLAVITGTAAAVSAVPVVAPNFVDSKIYMQFLGIQDLCTTLPAGVSQIPIVGELMAKAGLPHAAAGTVLLFTGKQLSEWIAGQLDKVAPGHKKEVQQLLGAIAKIGAVTLIVSSMAHGVGEGVSFLALIGGSDQLQALDIMRMFGTHQQSGAAALGSLGAVFNTAPSLHCLLMAIATGAKAWGDKLIHLLGGKENFASQSEEKNR